MLFRLNEPARVVFTIKRRRRAITIKGRSRARRPKKLRGRIVRISAPGRNVFRFTGRLRGRKLTPGRYILSAKPKGVGKPGHTRNVRFGIMLRRR